MEIIIENIQNKVEVNESLLGLLREAAISCLKNESFETPSELSVLLTDNEKIQELNNEYRNVNKPTDVLSFPMVEMDNGKILTSSGDYDMDEELLLLGDVVISMEIAENQAMEYGHSLEREIAFLLVHGIYHLLGYDHQDDEAEKRLQEKQEQVLAALGLKR